MLTAFFIIPLAACFLISLLGKRLKDSAELIANAAAIALLALAISTAMAVKSHKIIVSNLGGWLPPLGICFVADGLSAFMLVTVNTISFLVLLFAVAYMKRYTETWKFYPLFMCMLAGMNGVILSGDIFNLYLFLELASISGYVLVAFGTEAEDLEAAFKYAILGSLASIFILLGIGLLYSYTSTLNIADIASVLSVKPQGLLIKFVSVLFLAGFGLKAALVPFHAWLPDAHSSAPSPISAMLSGVFIKTLGIYTLIRVFFNMMVVQDYVLYILMVLGTLSMIVGAFLAVAQNDIKRMFAYSSISQVGYIFLALGIGTPLAILGGIFHLFNHAVFKSLLFLNAGAIEYSTGKRDLSQLGGLHSKLPVTGSTSLVASMSISGIPPFAGFWSKLIIIIAAVEAGHFGFAFAAAAISIVTLVYYLKFQTFAFQGKSAGEVSRVKEGPLFMRLPVIILAVLCVASAALLLPAAKPFLQDAANTCVEAFRYSEAVLGALR